MANGKLLRQLVRSGADGDVEAFRGVAKELVAEERQEHHHLLANDLETILYGRTQLLASPAMRSWRTPSPKTASATSHCVRFANAPGASRTLLFSYGALLAAAGLGSLL